MIWFISFIVTLYATLFLFTAVFRWICNGFSIRRTREEWAFTNELHQERMARKRAENAKLTKEWRAERKERLGY